MSRVPRIDRASAFALAVAAWLAPARAASQTFTIAPGVLVGRAGHGADLAGGLHLALRYRDSGWLTSITGRHFGVARSCTLTFPPRCSIDSPGGPEIMFGVARDLSGESAVRIDVGLEAGMALLKNNAEDRHVPSSGLGATLTLGFPVGSGTVDAGVLVHRVRGFWLRAVTLGLGIPIWNRH